MSQLSLIQNAHSDLVTDACYDMYGLHLATCGLDQRIKVWALDESTGQWNLQDDWKAHDAAITKLTWAHPEFGSIIASSSFDRTVKVWEQTVAESETQMNGNVPSQSSTRWTQRAVLHDAKGSVRAVEFASHHFGLKLAAISTDNYLRVYECLEQPSLTSWPLSVEVEIPSIASALKHQASMAPSRATATPTQTSTALDGASLSLAASVLAQQQQSSAPTRPGLGSREADGGWTLSWCKERYWGEVLAVGCGVDGTVKIIQFSPSARPMTVLTLEAPKPAPGSGPGSSNSNPSSRPTSMHSHHHPHHLHGAHPHSHSLQQGSNLPHGPESAYAVTSVAWAPSCGRSFHLVATGSRDGHVRVWKVKAPVPMMNDEPDAPTTMEQIETEKDEKWTAVLAGDFGDHELAVGRVEWNVTGTILSSAGNDGCVRLWKQTIGGIWRAAGHIGLQQAKERTQDTDEDVDESIVA